MYDDDNKINFFISSSRLENETLEKHCHHWPKNRSENSRFVKLGDREVSRFINSR